MKIETRSVDGIEDALYCMRHPMLSYNRADSHEENGILVVGENDMDLSKRLQKAGPEHRKHLRFIVVRADVKMPRYFYQQLDTYRAGVEKYSTSTMHKITARPFEEDDFEIDSDEWRKQLTDFMNERYKQWQEAGDEEERKMRWRDIIQCLPQSYLQLRTYMFSYEALRNIIKQRTGHKLTEWQYFIDWCKTLPESWMLFE